MSEAEYKALLKLFNECDEAFWETSENTRKEFFDILYEVHKQNIPGNGIFS